MVPTVQTLTVARDDHINEDYDYYVNAVLFGATVTCYVVLLFLLCYFLWKMGRSAVERVRAFYSLRKEGMDASVPYKGMKEENLSTISVIPVLDKGTLYGQEEQMRNPFWGPLHARAAEQAASVLPS